MDGSPGWPRCWGRILDVAEQLIAQSGEDIEIVFTGLREGEKLHEHLYGEAESGDRPKHPLVSHVAVPELRLSRVRRSPLDLPPEEMVEQLVTLCDEREGELVEERDLLPRAWSSIEA